MKIRLARNEDASAMSAVLQAIDSLQGNSRNRDTDYVAERYLQDPDRLACWVAEDDRGRIMGFQSLKRATAGNLYDVTVGWGIIGTHISPLSSRRGVGARLFQATRESACQHGIADIDATIAADNAAGLAYYEAMGFRTYWTTDSAVHKHLALSN